VSLLTPAQRELLHLFFEQAFADSFYLTGGTALEAYHLAHRVSLDLDLFTPSVDALQDAARFVIALRDEKRLTITSHFAQARCHNFRLAFHGERLRVDLCVDDLPQLPKEQRGEVRVDNLLDILANKVLAIIDFPEPKHLVDLFVGIRDGGVTATDVLAHAEHKRPIDAYHLARALHHGVHTSLSGLDMRTRIETAEMAAFFAQLRDHVLRPLRPPG
jgi:predicted nucleotidyltransferase component of viral defense system